LHTASVIQNNELEELCDPALDWKTLSNSDQSLQQIKDALEKGLQYK
jgi:hypothetical protein